MAVKKQARNSQLSDSSKLIHFFIEFRLTNNGWNIEFEKSVTFGKIDIFATHGNKTMIIEAKLFARAYTLALGQLLAYKESFPNARLVFACKENLDSRKKKFLNRYGIKTISSIEDLSI